MHYAIQIFQLLSIIFLAAGSYIWIRVPWWIDDNGISKISSGDKESIARNLISQKCDSKVAFFLIGLGTFSELMFIVLSDFDVGHIFSGLLKFVAFFLIGFLLYFIGNKYSRGMEKLIFKKQ